MTNLERVHRKKAKLISLCEKCLCSKQKPDYVFTLPGHALPSQYKTLLPVENAHVQTMLRLEKSSRRIRNLVFGLTALLVVVIITAIALIVSFQISDTAVTSQLTHYKAKTNRSSIAIIRPTSMAGMESVRDYTAWYNTDPDLGKRCNKRCWEFSAYNFRSTCEAGFCRCHSESYDYITCLPRVPGCQIRRVHPNAAASAVHLGQLQNLYVCRAVSASRLDVPEVHVVSMFDNHVTSPTELTVTSRRDETVTLVLVTSEPVTWDLTVEGPVTLKKVVLISNYRVSRTKIRFTKAAQNSADQPIITRASTNSWFKNSTSSSWSKDVSLHAPAADDSTAGPTNGPAGSTTGSTAGPHGGPTVERMVMTTGYGNDETVGNTPKLLRNIQKIIGSLNTFVGVAHAENIKVDLDFHLVET